ncbi:uncharacterized protein [Dermacentor albipictus]|uniref:uncharacterized protein n=1 Tax=Dermacentor albipictus TaxID=60249 RepID=UPI0038FBEB51
MAADGSSATETVPDCAPVKPSICADSENDNRPVRQNAFAWNAVEQRCTRVSSDTYCVRGSSAGFFRDVSECYLACGDGDDRSWRPGSPELSVLCPDVDTDAAELRRCRADDLLYPSYFDGTGCKEEHQRGQCRYHGRHASFETTEQCKEACLGKHRTDPASQCNATQPTFECRDELKKVTARFHADVGRCRHVRICLDGGYDTIAECRRHCGAKAYVTR